MIADLLLIAISMQVFGCWEYIKCPVADVRVSVSPQGKVEDREGHTRRWMVEGGTPNALFRNGVEPTEPAAQGSGMDERLVLPSRAAAGAAGAAGEACLAPTSFVAVGVGHAPILLL